MARDHFYMGVATPEKRPPSIWHWAFIYLTCGDEERQQLLNLCMHVMCSTGYSAWQLSMTSSGRDKVRVVLVAYLELSGWESWLQNVVGHQEVTSALPNLTMRSLGSKQATLCLPSCGPSKVGSSYLQRFSQLIPQKTDAWLCSSSLSHEKHLGRLLWWICLLEAAQNHPHYSLTLIDALTRPIAVAKSSGTDVHSTPVPDIYMELS